MLQVILESVFGGRVKTARIEGHCGTRTWSFCTATEGLRIVNAGIREGLWGTRETSALEFGHKICRHLPLETSDVAEDLKRFESVGSDKVVVEVNPTEDHKLVVLKVGGRVLQDAVLPDLCMPFELLEFYRTHGSLSASDCLAAARKMLELGVSDTISDTAFYRLTGDRARSLWGEGDYRRSVYPF